MEPRALGGLGTVACMDGYLGVVGVTCPHAGGSFVYIEACALPLPPTALGSATDGVDGFEELDGAQGVSASHAEAWPGLRASINGLSVSIDTTFSRNASNRGWIGEDVADDRNSSGVNGECLPNS